MEQAVALQPDYDEIVRDWKSRAPWISRVFARLGVQGKLIAGFVFIVLIGRGMSCWFFLHEANAILGPAGSCPEREAAFHHAEITSIAINTLASLFSIPVVLIIMHRIFEPIRTLVAAADRISEGELETRVAIHRPDAIGTLARSFNRMVHQLRKQQRSLEEVNARLAEANDTLEAKVQQRTAQLESANYRLHLEIAEKENFLRAISHDLSAPLRNISGMTAMLLHRKRDGFDDEVVHRLERIQKNVEVESALIRELVELSKIKTARKKLEDVDLNDLVREVAGVFEGDLQLRGIDFVVESSLPVLRCEKPRMRQLFQNLIDNSVKYMGEGTIDPATGMRAKQIRVGAVDLAGETNFYIRDTGMGIEPDDLEAIFYVFRRGRSAEVRAIAGRGVGLASVKSIVETYHGNIWVESEAGKGSTFRFTINGKYLVQSRELVGAM